MVYFSWLIFFGSLVNFEEAMGTLCLELFPGWEITQYMMLSFALLVSISSESSFCHRLAFSVLMALWSALCCFYAWMLWPQLGWCIFVDNISCFK